MDRKISPHFSATLPGPGHNTQGRQDTAGPGAPKAALPSGDAQHRESPGTPGPARSIPDPAKAIRELVCECGKVRGHETACFGATSVVDHAEAIVREAKAGIAVALEALVRTRCHTTYDSEGYARDEWADE